jgi:hypothetical protein
MTRLIALRPDTLMYNNTGNNGKAHHMKRIRGAEGKFHVRSSFVLIKVFALLSLHKYFMLTDQGHDQDLVHPPILDVMAVAYMLKAVIEASQRLQG